MTRQAILTENQRAVAMTERGKRGRWWRRKGTKKSGFRYETFDGKPVKAECDLERIKSLVIPPAWSYVRISPLQRSNLQAVGIDTAGRVQYIYHSNFAAKQQAKKFTKVERFGAVLPTLRRITNEHIQLEGFPRERILAVVIRLINELYIRIGNENSVRRYRTYGITTLRNKHVEIKRGKVIFNFVGKHHIRHRRVLVDEELATLLADLKALGGAKLFHYLDENQKPKPVTSKDVNEYLKSVTASEFSAKDFRTWGATLLAAIELADMKAAENEQQAKKNIVKAVKKVAEHLGNTPSVCRGCYIHPKVLKAYEKGITLEETTPKNKRRVRRIQPEYQIEEIALLNLLKKDY